MQSEAHTARFQSLAFNAMDSEAWAGMQAEEGHLYIVGLEVLDNLPHDRVEWVDQGWMETWVSYCDDRHPHGTQELRELSDGEIAGCLGACDWDGADQSKAEEESQESQERGGDGILASLERFITTGSTTTSKVATTREGGENDVLFLPTAAFSLLKNISANVPSHTLLLMDFSSLPDVQVPGMNAPLISNTVDGRANDFASYFVPVGAADIFFPTDFDALSSMYMHQMSRQPSGSNCNTVVDARHVRSDEFFKVYGDLNVTTTLSGFNPLIEDFLNTRVFIGSRG